MRQQIPEDIEEIAELAAMLGSTVNSYKGLADPRDPNSRKLFGNPVTPGEMVGSYMQGRKAGGPYYGTDSPTGAIYSTHTASPTCADHSTTPLHLRLNLYSNNPNLISEKRSLLYPQVI